MQELLAATPVWRPQKRRWVRRVAGMQVAAGGRGGAGQCAGKLGHRPPASGCCLPALFAVLRTGPQGLALRPEPSLLPPALGPCVGPRPSLGLRWTD